MNARKLKVGEKKMIKRLFIVSLLLIAILAIAGCSEKNNLVGLWRGDGYEDYGSMEFTSDGQWFSHFGIGKYQMLDDGTIEITVPEGKEVLSNVNITKTTFTFQSWWDELLTFTREKGYSNLKSDILGTWIGEVYGDSITFMFDKNGNFSMGDEYGGESGNFTVLSDNTILINLEDDEVIYIYVMDLSNNQFTLSVWQENLEDLIFIRER